MNYSINVTFLRAVRFPHAIGFSRGLCTIFIFVHPVQPPTMVLGVSYMGVLCLITIFGTLCVI